MMANFSFLIVSAEIVSAVKIHTRQITKRK